MGPAGLLLHMHPIGLNLEVFSLLLIILASFLIYYKTREIYELTEHSGIKYFRRGFLFFGLGHFLTLLFVLYRPYLRAFLFFEPGWLFLVFLIFDFIALSYLFSSLFSKKIKEYVIYFLTAFVFGLSFLFASRIFLIGYSLALAVGLGIVSYKKIQSRTKKKFFSQIYVLYFSLFLFWVFEFLGRVLTQVYDFGRWYVHVFTALFFMYFLYLVLKKLNIGFSKENGEKR